MSRITRAHHTGLTVRSLDRSVAFYRDVLGFEVAFAWNPRAPYIRELVGYPSVDLHAVILRIPGSDVFLELLEYRGVDAIPWTAATPTRGRRTSPSPSTTSTRSTPSSRPRVSPACRAPVTPTIGPNKGGRAVYMIDPDGFRVELIQSSIGFGEYRPDDSVRRPVGMLLSDRADDSVTPRRATLRDVAALAKVDASLVSRVINGDPKAGAAPRPANGSSTPCASSTTGPTSSLAGCGWPARGPSACSSPA